MKLILAVLILLAAYPVWTTAHCTPVPDLVEVAYVLYEPEAGEHGKVRIVLRSLDGKPVDMTCREFSDDPRHLYIASYPPLYDLRESQVLLFRPIEPMAYDWIKTVNPPGLEIDLLASVDSEDVVVLGWTNWMTGVIQFVQPAIRVMGHTADVGDHDR